MPSYRSAFLVIATGVFLLGLFALSSIEHSSLPALPRLPQTSKPSTGPAKPVIDRNDVIPPWAHTAPASVRVIPPVAPTTVVEIPPDTTSVRYLGAMTGNADVKTYLFKFLPNGKALSLIEGQEAHGWTLTKVTPQMFMLKGPGGHYVVSR